MDTKRTRRRKVAVRKAGKAVNCAILRLERPGTRLSAPTLTRQSAAPAMRMFAATTLLLSMWKSVDLILLLSLWRAARWRWRNIVKEELRFLTRMNVPPATLRSVMRISVIRFLIRSV